LKPLSEFINRILCADARAVLSDLPNESIDLILTDPPYGDNISYGPRKVRIPGNDHPLLALEVLHSAYRLVKRNTAAYMFCGMRHLPFVRAFFAQYTRYRLRDVLIWDKVTMGVGYGFRKQYECILALEKGRPSYRNSGMLNLLSYRKVRDGSHPHAKPLPLLKALIAHSSNQGGVVLDPFLGSGATALAAKHLGRKYIGIEVNPVYCRIAANRLRQPMLPLIRNCTEPQSHPVAIPSLAAISATPSRLQKPVW